MEAFKEAYAVLGTVYVNEQMVVSIRGQCICHHIVLSLNMLGNQDEGTGCLHKCQTSPQVHGMHFLA